MDQDSNVPVPKVVAAFTAGSTVTAILTLLAQFNIIIPPEVGNAAVVLIGAIVTIVSFVAGYFKRSNSKEQ